MTDAGAPTKLMIAEQTAQIGEQTVHYLQAGAGPTLVVLLHGWPQSSHEWRAVMPLLAERYTIIAPDLRGIGGTSVPHGDFDTPAFAKTALAADVHALITALGPALGIECVVVAGHDIGGMVAYAYARQYPGHLAGAVIMDIPIPGLEPWDEIKTSPLAWHFGLHKQKPLAETLIQGHQAQYFSSFYYDGLAVHPEAITAEDVEHYATAYGSEENLRAMCELYRAFPQDEQFNTARTERLDVPVLVLGGETTFARILPTIAASLTAAGVRDVRTAVVEGSGHWMAEEQPARTASLIDGFAAGLAPARCQV